MKKKKKILLIEDDMATIDVYKTGLTQAGFKVEIAITGEEAINRINEAEKNLNERPDLILLDIILPDIDGMDILRKIREMENIKDTKVLILTNYTSKEFEKKSSDLKAEKYILKSENPPSSLLQIIKEEIDQ